VNVNLRGKFVSVLHPQTCLCVLSRKRASKDSAEMGIDMIITLINDTFNTNNNGTTISAMRFAKALSKRGHTVRIVACGDPKKSGIDPENGLEMFYVPELILPIASRLAHKQSTLFAKPVRPVLQKAIKGADVVHIYQPWPIGHAAQRIAKKLGVPAIAGFHIQPENITYNIGLGWFPPAAHLAYYLLNLTFYRKFKHIHCPSKFIAAQLRSHGYRARLHVISNGVAPEFCPGTSRKRQDGELYKVLMVGRLSAEKRQDVLIKAVQKSQNAQNIQLYFAGRGPKLHRLQKMGAKLPHPPIFGYYNQEGLIELMRSCDFYVHASDIEIEGISCIEAFSCGLVPIISDSVRSATVQFALGPECLFRSGSPASLAERMDAWISDPQKLSKTGKMYAEYAKAYSLVHSIRSIEKVYRSASLSTGKNNYVKGRLYRLSSTLFYYIIAVPVLSIWIRVILGVKVIGEKHLRGIKGAMTVCNHVHTLDCALVALALFPRKIVFPTLPENVQSIWPGKIVRLLGGVAIPGNMTELKQFFDEMEFLLVKRRIVHIFPEGDLKPYDTSLRDFKKGAFHLAAQARVPVVPISITFQPPKGIKKLYRRKPIMTLHIGEPIYPAAIDPQEDLEIRMKLVKKQMNNLIAKPASGE
jgi:1-acyl-sn-glycerol-3-phosphate acyltransferase